MVPSLLHLYVLSHLLRAGSEVKVTDMDGALCSHVLHMFMRQVESLFEVLKAPRAHGEYLKVVRRNCRHRWYASQLQNPRSEDQG